MAKELEKDKERDSYMPSEDRKNHILVVSQYFHPENFRINDMCLEWVKRGYKVSVVTGIPNYPEGRFYPGYGFFKKRHENWNGINIYRLFLLPRGKSRIGLALNYFSFMISGIIAGKIRRIEPDIVFSFEVSPMTQVLTGVSFARRHRVPHLLYVQDLWPENVTAVMGIDNGFIIDRINKMVDRIYKNTDEIFVTSPSFARAITGRRNRVSGEKVHYWPQYSEELYKPVERSEAIKVASEYGIDNDGYFKVIFTGNVGNAQGLDVLPRAAKLLKHERIKFVIVGDGRYMEEFRRQIASLQVEDMFILVPRQPAEKIPTILCACDASFVSFADNDLWNKTIPAKLQSYMACGMPVIASAGGETARIISESGCGICCKTGDENDLSDGIIRIMKANLEEMAVKSLAYCRNHFNKKNLMDEMDMYLSDGDRT